MSYIGRIQQAMVNVVPWFLRRANIGRLLEASSVTLDASTEALHQGLKLSQPWQCDESALEILGRDRGIRLYSTEPASSKRDRLARWRQLRREFGTHAGEMHNVQPFFSGHVAIPRMRIVHQPPDASVATWHTVEPDGTYSWSRKTPSNWNWDGFPVNHTRYWLIIYVDQAILSAEGAGQLPWDGVQLWDGGSIWDGLLTSLGIADIVAGVNEASAPHSQLHGVILAPDPATFDPTASVVTHADGWTNLPNGNWGWAIDNTTGKPTRQPGASFVYDLGPGDGS